MSWYKQVFNKRCYKLRWHYLNDVLGGLMPGKLWTLVGKYKVGKTFFMLRMACDLWLEQGANVLFCSAEMNNEELKLRLLSMISGLSFSKVVQCSLNEEEEKRYEVALKRIENAKGQLYVLGRGEGCDLFNVEYIMKDRQIDVLFVDSFYLMGNAKSEYERVDQALSMVLNICKSNNIPVVVSTQFNREGAKMKADSGMDQSMYVAYNLNTVRLSDVVIGLLRDQMLAELKRMYVAILASRYSRSDVRFAVSWDMDNMEFEEVRDLPGQAEALDKYVEKKIKEEYMENVEAG
jgi:KaiC/GvpD/RAD55 family RecA-like ATPase